LPEQGGAAGLSGQSLVFVRGRPVLIGSDGAFRYAGAVTAQPLIVLSFSKGHFVNVTRSYSALIARSARLFWSQWRSEAPRKPANGMTVLPVIAWAAVECAVGHQATAYRTLSSLANAGWFNWPAKDGPRGSSFVRVTEHELGTYGYCVR
jgi:hypothetical protein